MFIDWWYRCTKVQVIRTVEPGYDQDYFVALVMNAFKFFYVVIRTVTPYWACTRKNTSDFSSKCQNSFHRSVSKVSVLSSITPSYLI